MACGKPKAGSEVSSGASAMRQEFQVIALPPNKGMQLTAKSVTPFACAKGAPLLSAADPRR